MRALSSVLEPLVEVVDSLLELPEPVLQVRDGRLDASEVAVDEVDGRDGVAHHVGREDQGSTMSSLPVWRMRRIEGPG